MTELTTPTGKRLASCPWSWHGLSCALLRGHPSPHHIIGEQPQFAAIEAKAVKAERERLRSKAEEWFDVGAVTPDELRAIRAIISEPAK